MPKQNVVYLKGPVIKLGINNHIDGSSEGVCVLGVIRGYRQVGDGRNQVKIDRPIIMSRNQDIVNQMMSFKKNDIICVKGAIATRTVMKASVCPNCKNKNEQEGLAVYIEPIFIEKVGSQEDDSSSLNYLNSIREISNQVFMFGNLTRDPKKVKVKNGPIVTQYPLAVHRKFTVKEDLPSVDVDFPWVKVYGQNAISDRERLKKGSTVFIDGLIQTRSINKKAVCEHCKQRYEWKDRALEIVPYETEYISGYYTEEEVLENEKERKKQILKSKGLDKFSLKMDNDFDESDEITDEDIAAGIDIFEEDEE